MSREIITTEGALFLFQNALRSIPFNVLIAGLFCFDLLYKKLPFFLVLYWFISIVIISLIRWWHSKRVIHKKAYLYNANSSIRIFSLMTFIMGCLWGVSYLIFMPYVPKNFESVIILILGGMAAGAIASLSAYLPAYYAYVVPMFLPAIIHNYSFFGVQRSILATMYILFVVMVITIARNNNHLLSTVIHLNYQKDSLINQLSVSNKKLEEFNEEIRVMSITDSLTGLYNRRYFDNSIANELARAQRHGYPLSLMLIDIDNFKYINDHYGHPYGDSYLIFVASVLKKTIRRSNDILVRLGGDEFAAILADLDLGEVKSLCDKIKLEFNKENQHDNVTLSIGIISIEPDNKTDLKNIIAAADKMLYQAKEKGKNTIISQKI